MFISAVDFVKRIHPDTSDGDISKYIGAKLNITQKLTKTKNADGDGQCD